VGRDQSQGPANASIHLLVASDRTDLQKRERTLRCVGWIIMACLRSSGPRLRERELDFCLAAVLFYERLFDIVSRIELIGPLDPCVLMGVEDEVERIRYNQGRVKRCNPRAK
jgi:hypothetical protein